MFRQDTNFKAFALVICYEGVLMDFVFRLLILEIEESVVFYT